MKTEFNPDSIKDSGERQKFNTGAVRDPSAGKGRYDLLSPLALRRLAQHMENGARKYSARNWEKGMPLSRFLDSAIRHTYQVLEGDESEDHAAAAMWNLHGFIHTQMMIAAGQLPEDLNDLPHAEAKRNARDAESKRAAVERWVGDGFQGVETAL